MNEARFILPTDVVSLISYNPRAYPNEAWPRERLGGRSAAVQALGVTLDPLMTLMRSRSAWVLTRGSHLEGLAGARQRGSKDAWEIDVLIDTTEDKSSVASLLDSAAMQAGRQGAEKLFVRLAADSPCLDAVAGSGFLTYVAETLYARVGLAPGVIDETLRPITTSDGYQAFRLYNATTPETVRRCEASTFREWHGMQERRWLRRGVTLVREHEGALDALIRAARLPQGVAIELCLTPDASREMTPLIRKAVSAVGGTNQPIYVLTPSGSAAVSALEGAGFDHQGEYVSLLRRTTRPVTIPMLLPSIAKTAVGV